MHVHFVCHVQCSPSPEHQSIQSIAFQFEKPLYRNSKHEFKSNRIKWLSTQSTSHTRILSIEYGKEMECIEINGRECFIFKWSPAWTFDILKSTNQLIIHGSAYLKQTIHTDRKKVDEQLPKRLHWILFYILESWIPNQQRNIRPKLLFCGVRGKAIFFFVPKIDTCSDSPTIAIETLLSAAFDEKYYHFVLRMIQMNAECYENRHSIYQIQRNNDNADVC